MNHLLALSVGPVQEFIAAARRTRDLWFGSYLLSEISKAVAKSVKDQGGQLIFPHPETELTPRKEEVNVANVVLAELPTGDPREVAAEAREAAQNRWLEFVKDAWETASGIIRKEIWDDQVDDVIDYYAAWVKQTGNYPADRGRLMRLLAGRKNCRDFLPAKGRPGVPKSSLDGQRESVLKDPAKEQWPERLRARLRIREGEQLDVVGLVKRVAEGNRPYPSVSRIAADPWVRGNKDKPTFKVLKAACENLPTSVLHCLDAGAFPKLQDFGFEGTAVYVSRHHEWLEEIDDDHDRDQICESISAIRGVLSKPPEPNPYLAVLIADGDRMGAAISNLQDVEANRAFSGTLAGFATAAQTIVADHQGVLVYAGGDDVLAFLPVDKCLECARKLHDAFGQRLAAYGNPTLSVGIAIGHFMENLEDLLDYGRAAEKAAKGVSGKDALGVHLHKRSGSPVKIASRWETRPDKRLTLYAELMQKDALPSKLPYDLYKLVELYDGDGWVEQVRQQAMQNDALRIIADKQPRAGRKHMSTVRKIVSKLGSVEDLRQFCEELLIARLLAEVFDQAGREPTEPLQLQEETAA